MFSDTHKQIVDAFGYKETTPTAIGELVSKYSKSILSRFCDFVNRGKGEKMRYRIKARLADLGLRSVDLIDMVRKAGLRVTGSEFSRAINGRDYSPKAEMICETANRILDQIENKRGK